MSDINERREDFSIALSLLDKFFLDGVFNEKEREEIASKIASKYGFKKTSVLVTKSLISTLINESMCVENEVKKSGD